MISQEAPGLLKSAIALALLGICTGVFAEQSGDIAPSKRPEKLVGKIRAEVALDDATGRLTYSIRCTSDEPVKLHFKSLEGVEVELLIAPDVNLEKVPLEFKDYIRPDANTTLPYGVKARTVSTSRGDNDAEYYQNVEREEPRDRTVELKKDEAISRSFYLYDMPWFEDLVAALKKGKFKAYRIDPSPFIYTVNEQGQPIIDHHVEVWDTEADPAGGRRGVFHTGGIVLDLATVKKIQALKPPEKPEKKGEKE